MDDDPLLLGQRVLAILETGLRTATYKLATLSALIDHCVENLPDRPDAPPPVPIPDIAHRVLELHWRQVRPFDGHDLRQSTQPRARILIATNRLGDAAGRTNRSVEFAKLAVPDGYRQAIDDIALCLAQQPLYRLQNLPGSSTSDAFLYDDGFLHDQVSLKILRTHDFSIVLKPGVAYGLARLAGLLKPTLEILWVEDVRRMNKFLDADVPDVARHLFGRQRTALAAVREPFKDVFGTHCSIANRTWPSTIRSTMGCLGSESVSTDWRTWCCPAPAATATRAARCPRSGSLTELSGATAACLTSWLNSFSGPPSTSVSSPPARGSNSPPEPPRKPSENAKPL